jgi:ABC-type spermidine/putrescine transport system permease subunit II
MNKTVRNERRKFTASWLNSVATALMTAGAFAPIASEIYGFGSTQPDPKLIFLSSSVCVAVSFILHLYGRRLLGDIEE